MHILVSNKEWIKFNMMNFCGQKNYFYVNGKRYVHKKNAQDQTIVTRKKQIFWKHG